VATDDRDREEGTEETGDETNVVSFPRDWLGPREELVPFGKEGQSAEDAAHSRPPRAADFWDEGAAAIHDAVEAPDDADADAASTHRPRGRVLVAAIMLALTCAVVGLTSLGGAGSHRSGAELRSARASSPGEGAFLTLGISGAMARAEARIARAARQRRPARAALRSHPHSPPVIEVSVRQTASSSVPASAERSVSRPQRSATGSTGTGSGDGGSSSGSASTSAASGGNGAAGTPAGPTGEGALVSPGSTPSG
jgi:hypothetical protein